MCSGFRMHLDVRKIWQTQNVRAVGIIQSRGSPSACALPEFTRI